MVILLQSIAAINRPCRACGSHIQIFSRLTAHEVHRCIVAEEAVCRQSDVDVQAAYTILKNEVKEKSNSMIMRISYRYRKADLVGLAGKAAAAAGAATQIGVYTQDTTDGVFTNTRQRLEEAIDRW